MGDFIKSWNRTGYFTCCGFGLASESEYMPLTRNGSLGPVGLAWDMIGDRTPHDSGLGESHMYGGETPPANILLNQNENGGQRCKLNRFGTW